MKYLIGLKLINTSERVAYFTKIAGKWRRLLQQQTNKRQLSMSYQQQYKQEESIPALRHQALHTATAATSKKKAYLPNGTKHDTLRLLLQVKRKHTCLTEPSTLHIATAATSKKKAYLPNGTKHDTLRLLLQARRKNTCLTAPSTTHCDCCYKQEESIPA